MNKKLIVYDWNGTLIDDTWITAQCFSFVIAPWGLPPLTAETFRQAYDVPWTVMYKNMGVSDAHIAQLSGHPIGENFLNDYETRINQAKLHNGTSAILQSMTDQGIDQIILSNHIEDRILEQLNRLGISKHFKTILAYKTYSAEERKTTKLDKLQQYICEKNLKPSDIIIVGDTPEEIKIAKQLGLACVSFTFGYASETRLKKESPHLLVHSMEEFGHALVSLLYSENHTCINQE